MQSGEDERIHYASNDENTTFITMVPMLKPVLMHALVFCVGPWREWQDKSWGGADTAADECNTGHKGGGVTQVWSSTCSAKDTTDVTVGWDATTMATVEASVLRGQTACPT